MTALRNLANHRNNAYIYEAGIWPVRRKPLAPNEENARRRWRRSCAIGQGRRKLCDFRRLAMRFCAMQKLLRRNIFTFSISHPCAMAAAGCSPEGVGGFPPGMQRLRKG
jgi:hypothetical protein